MRSRGLLIIVLISQDPITSPLGYAQAGRLAVGVARAGLPVGVVSIEPADTLRSERRRSRASELGDAGVEWLPVASRRKEGMATAVRNLTRAALAMSRRFHRPLVWARSFTAAVAALALRELRGWHFVYDTRGYWIANRKRHSATFARLAPLLERLDRRCYARCAAAVFLTELGVQDARRGLLASWPPSKAAVCIPTCTDFAPFESLRAPTRGEGTTARIHRLGQCRLSRSRKPRSRSQRLAGKSRRAPSLHHPARKSDQRCAANGGSSRRSGRSRQRDIRRDASTPRGARLWSLAALSPSREARQHAHEVRGVPRIGRCADSIRLQRRTHTLGSFNGLQRGSRGSVRRELRPSTPVGVRGSTDATDVAERSRSSPVPFLSGKRHPSIRPTVRKPHVEFRWRPRRPSTPDAMMMTKTTTCARCRKAVPSFPDARA